MLNICRVVSREKTHLEQDIDMKRRVIQALEKELEDHRFALAVRETELEEFQKFLSQHEAA